MTNVQQRKCFPTCPYAQPLLLTFIILLIINYPTYLYYLNYLFLSTEHKLIKIA